MEDSDGELTDGETLVLTPGSGSGKLDVAAGEVGAFNGANWQFKIEGAEDDSNGGRN
jgi:hypothetical protein